MDKLHIFYCDLRDLQPSENQFRATLQKYAQICIHRHARMYPARFPTLNTHLRLSFFCGQFNSASFWAGLYVMRVIKHGTYLSLSEYICRKSYLICGLKYSASKSIHGNLNVRRVVSNNPSEQGINKLTWTVSAFCISHNGSAAMLSGLLPSFWVRERCISVI
jgi:hypothetical protein